MINLRQLFILLLLVSGTTLGQEVKPRVYVNREGQRFTRAQFDSIGVANVGSAVAQIERIETDKEIRVIFEILSSTPESEISDRWSGKRFPDLEMTDVNGVVHSTTSLNGKIVVINFWSTTCAPCLREIPRLNDLVAKYDKENVVFLAVAPDPKEEVSRVVKKNPFSYTLVADAKRLYDKLGISGYPYHMVIDSKGYIHSVFQGTRLDSKTNLPVMDNRIVKSIDSLMSR